VKGKVLGVIILNHELSIAYTAADLKLLMAIASQASAAIDNTLLHEHKLLEERIKANLGRYVASEVVNAIFDSQGETSLAPVKKHVTILFSDIRNFTTQCELLAPEQVVEYLNEYFTAMVEEIFRYGGTVNKFVGDMIVAIFGAPYPLENNEQKAIETAIAMQKCLKLMPIAWIRDNFHTGIGISSGEVVVGNVGSPQHMDYTAIGDEVNIASRLQALAKGGQILVSRNIYELNQDKFQFRTIGSVSVKGKQKAVEVFEVIY
jgi:class 3 adenylate cyclase